MRRTLFRIFLLAGALAYMAVLSANVMGAWYLDQPNVEKLSRGLRWNPGNPLLWTQYGSYRLYASGGSESKQAEDAFLRAAAMNPLDPANWNGLATAYLQMRESRKAEAALRALLVAVPLLPQSAWRLGNFLLVADQPKEAFPYLRAAAATEVGLRWPLFDLAWKILDDPEDILRGLIPDDPEAREEYLRFLMYRRKLTEADAVWREVRSNHGKDALKLGSAYVDALVASGMGAEAAKVWEALLADTGRAGAKPAGELLTNGDFEAGLPNVGLDWRLVPGAGYEIGLDDSVFQAGAHSLRVTFDGTANVDFAAVQQMVPVEPNQEYRFQAYLKTENITTDNGVLFGVVTAGGAPGDSAVFKSENRVGTNPWRLEQLDFRTGPKTRFVQVVLRRYGSSKFNNLIQGKVWMDSVTLRARP